MVQHHKSPSILQVLHKDMLLMLGFSAVNDIVHGNIYYQQYFTNVVVDYEALFPTSAS